VSIVEKNKPYCNGEWTQARFNSFIKSALRSASQRWPPKYLVLQDAYVGIKTNPKTGRQAKHFHCKSCGEAFPQKEVEVNHITPVVPIDGFDSWDGVIYRMFCEKDGLEVLCKPCHKAVTKQENELRKNK
jgi:5-methylcytosine-specific restriction endonuclease McrA